jgi:hypothetical protein
MKIPPVTPPSNHLQRRHRAFISIRSHGDKTEFTVIDSTTGERTVLPEKKAWELHQRINRGEFNAADSTV